MPQVLIDDVDSDVLDRIQARAHRSGRSLEGELRLILREAAGRSRQEYYQEVVKLRERLGDRRLSDSTELIRQARGSR